MTTSDQGSSSDIMLRLVGLYREAAQAAAETHHHVKQAADLFELDPVHPERLRGAVEGQGSRTTDGGAGRPRCQP
jgi:hypothetical protein